MTRPQADDLLQSFRFSVSSTDDVLKEAAGFNNVTTPEVSVESVDYREGNRTYTKKQPGVPTVEAATFTKGIARTDSSFWDWLKTKLLGGQPYRADIDIKAYGQSQPGAGVTGINDMVLRQVTCLDCFPTRVKLIGDLDATSSDINIQEIECSVEEVLLSGVDIPLT